MKKKSQKQKKKLKPRLLSYSSLIEKSRVTGSNNLYLKQHNDLVANCIEEIASTYSDYEKMFSNRISKIDDLTNERKIQERENKPLHHNEISDREKKNEEAKKSLEVQRDALEKFSNEDPCFLKEKTILAKYSQKHLSLKRKIKDDFHSSRIVEFVEYANDQYSKYLKVLKDKAVEYDNEIINRKLSSISSKDSIATDTQNELWSSFIKESGLSAIDNDFIELMNTLLKHLKVRMERFRTFEIFERSFKRQSREINETSIEINGTLPWKILPTKNSMNEISILLQRELSSGNITNKEMIAAKIRMQRIIELNPQQIYKGIDTFSDYFALIFEHSDKVIFESIRYGNAIYIVGGDWVYLSQRTKQELRNRNDTSVIRHEGDWFFNLKRHLALSKSRRNR